MRRRLWALTKLVSVGVVMAFGGCGITPLQLEDFAVTTVLQLVAQTVVNVVAGGIGT